LDLTFSLTLSARSFLELELEVDDSTLRTMCGSRTGVWSLPCVMSD
jgi:hypothetical protein